MMRFENIKYICPNCKSEEVAKYVTYEHKHYQAPHRLRPNIWFWCAVDPGRKNPTPENDYYKCEGCGLTWRTRKPEMLDKWEYLW